MADHYVSLGVNRDASQDEIKRAYRKLARELHPDAGHADPEAEERFKSVTHAYEVLSDPQKRQRYDTFGDDRAGAANFSDFGGVSDLFSTFFGGGFGGQTRRRGPGRGSDILAEVVLTLEDAAEGTEREVEVTTLAECNDCHGSGAAPGTFPVQCTDCGGTGELREVRRTMLGNMITATTCPKCRGTGEEIVDRCKNCGGTGRVQVTDVLTVQIPPGVDDGSQLRVSGRGEAGLRGGVAGDLYVAIRVEEHPIFRRAGADLGCEVGVPMTVAALGGTIEIPTLDGTEPIEIEPGTQAGELIHLKGKGMPRLQGRGRGEIVAMLRVETPTDLTEEQEELLRRFADLRSEETGNKSVFDRIKEAFQ
ncbi:MAG: molecular chaperone DnaJ [Actinomycetota bacterium]|jgi:molecular chaperone DnaJ|nr:molecular chaperone DnaJ [Actinomycetota bacterium]